MRTVSMPANQRFILAGEPWCAYTRWLKLFDERRHVRITYDRGVLEIVTLTHEHERGGRILARLIDAWTEERNIDVWGGGSTTFRRRDLRRGLEPDECFWIANEPRVRGLSRIDLRRDPPPDLVVEVDVTHSSVPRLPIYASLGVSEVWRLRGTALSFHLLQPDGAYRVSVSSAALPPLTPKDLAPYLTLSSQLGDTAAIRQFRAWVRQLPPTTP